MICQRFATGDGVGKGECRENAPQDSRASRASRARVRGFQNFEPRTSGRAFLVCLAIHASQTLADFFNSLIVMEVIQSMEGL
jgi:hypothetical protein